MSDGNSGELLVGVNVLPDGTQNICHALRMVDGTLRIKDPIVDRLRGDLVIDTKREAHYQALQAGMVHMDREGTLTDWFIGLVNGSKAEGQNDISAGDITSL